MTTSKYLVSVLMTAYNRERYIAEAIESVLTSSYTNFELIIVDDCSSDHTAEIANSYALKDSRIVVYKNEKNLGDYPNRNKAASFASGAYITYVDSDDAIFKDTIQVMIDAAMKYRDAALFMPVRANDLEPESFQYFSSAEAFNMHFKVNGFLETAALGVLIKKEIFDFVGGFSGKRMIGDVELWLKIAAKFPIVRLKKNMVFWREHAGQEFKQGTKYYLVDALEMYRHTLLSQDCPIDLKEGARIYDGIKKERFKTLLKHILKTGNIRESYGYYKMMRAIN